MNRNIWREIIILIIGVTIAFFVFTECSFWGTRYDSDIPDTNANQRRFEETFNFEPTNDVKNLYCFMDPMGFDVSYQFAFSCNENTIQKIVSELHLTKAKKPDHYSSGIQYEFPWWSISEVGKLTPYHKVEDEKYHWYLWYDTLGKKAYYLEFDL